ncbi:hypothetical protein [Streptomyces sp. NPDC055607]
MSALTADRVTPSSRQGDVVVMSGAGDPVGDLLKKAFPPDAALRDEQPGDLFDRPVGGDAGFLDQVAGTEQQTIPWSR